jgi:sigma-B regulation protein RsbU (phosphoserine phosphatase)
MSSSESSEVPDGVHHGGRLAGLLSLTDSTLTRLDLDELLVELLARVREILDGDTAAVLLLDEGADALVARAAISFGPCLRADVA